MNTRNIFLIVFLVLAIQACKQRNEASKQAPGDYVQIQHPAWTKNANIYEVNIRQYSSEGTFKAFQQHLPRLKEMGIDVLWMMPVHPIGKQNRKGTLGSFYAVQDYYGINPEFGDMQDFKNLVDAAHAMGMHVIIDWVANHSSWDNALVKQHPGWYIKNREGNFQSTPWRDYDDIIDFDYSNDSLRRYMTDAMKFWVKETGIDGFRCDVASFVPINFWEDTRKALDSIEPVFMLAEAADRDLHQKSFDATYSWQLWDVLHGITTKNTPVDALAGGYIAEHVSIWPRNGYRMNFIDNHDKNAWEGNQYMNFKNGLYASIVLTCTIDGMPMLYSGQEAGLNRSLQFFEKDTIQWKADSIGILYSKLFNLRHRNKALWSGSNGGEMVRIRNNKMQQVISFVREKDGDKIIVIANLSNLPAYFTVASEYDKGNYQEVFTENNYRLSGTDSLQLAAWQYLVLERK